MHFFICRGRISRILVRFLFCFDVIIKSFTAVTSYFVIFILSGKLLKTKLKKCQDLQVKTKTDLEEIFSQLDSKYILCNEICTISLTLFQFMHLLVEYRPEIVGGWEATEKERMLNKNRGMLHTYIHTYTRIHHIHIKIFILCYFCVCFFPNKCYFKSVILSSVH